MSEIQNYYHLSKLKAIVLFYPGLEFSNIKSHHQNLLEFLFEFRKKKSSKTEAQNATSFQKSGTSKLADWQKSWQSGKYDNVMTKLNLAKIIDIPRIKC